MIIVAAVLEFVLSLIILFFLGAAVGSFLNVLVQRTLSDEDWVHDRSKCDHCGKRLKWYNNIPLLSWLFQRGKAQCCGKQLSVSHPVVELLSGTLFVWWYVGSALFFRITETPFTAIQPLFWLMVGVLLLWVLVADWRYMLIPDQAIWLLTGVTLVYRLGLTSSGVMQWDDLWWTFFAVVVNFALFFGLWWGTKGKGMGFGDVKLAVPMALLLGWPRTLVGLFLAFVFGAIIGLILIATKKQTFGRPIPFGPFMIAGIFAALLFGDELIQWYLGNLGL